MHMAAHLFGVGTRDFHGVWSEVSFRRQILYIGYGTCGVLNRRIGRFTAPTPTFRSCAIEFDNDGQLALCSNERLYAHSSFC